MLPITAGVEKRLSTPERICGVVASPAHLAAQHLEEGARHPGVELDAHALADPAHGLLRA